MLTLQTLRQARALARGVLAWFVLSIGLAIAAPLVQPQSLEMICSATGQFKLVGDQDGDTNTAASHTLQCVMCLALGAPPPTDFSVSTSQSVQPLALTNTPATHLAWRTASPLPARGPPSSL
jgi:hypothetical protein